MAPPTRATVLARGDHREGSSRGLRRNPMDIKARYRHVPVTAAIEERKKLSNPCRTPRRLPGRHDFRQFRREHRQDDLPKRWKKSARKA